MAIKVPPLTTQKTGPDEDDVLNTQQQGPADPGNATVSSPDTTAPPVVQPVKTQPKAKLNLDALEKLLDKASPEQKARFLKKLKSEKLAGPGRRKDVEGNVLIEIKISRDLLQDIENWREASGLSFEDQVQQIVDVAFPSYLMAPWPMSEPEAPKPAEPAKPAAAPAAPPAPAPAAAATTT